MQQYYNHLRMRDIFMNSKLSGVFPQFDLGEKLQNVYSFAKTEERVRKYLIAVFNGSMTDDGAIAVNGKYQVVLNRVRALQTVVEGFINNMPKVAQALRSNMSLYLPYATLKQLEETKTIAAKIKAMRAVMDNFQYNADFGSLNSVKKEKPEQFNRNRKTWEKKVGYRRLKKV